MIIPLKNRVQMHPIEIADKARKNVVFLTLCYLPKINKLIFLVIFTTSAEHYKRCLLCSASGAEAPDNNY
ncbi:hypothetical protein AYY17_16365 [Morganella psychrotolerans]|uniref:Uncharacterized protein n=1 Tax=Morganella psychrotolerans TaxID=368603 RepID=A0A1B8HM66_9GAMM|nr:hypothetical protein AYY17_16365 [Morganella psychrotolerans]